MRCTGLSVIKGTEISSFNVEIAGRDRGGDGPQRPADPDPGVRPGRGRHRHRPRLLGLPDLLRRPQRRRDLRGPRRVRQRGRARHADRGDDPRPPARSPPAGARHDPPLLRAARPLDTPLDASAASRAAPRRSSGRRRAALGRPLFVAPAGPARRLPAAWSCARAPRSAAAISTGDLALGAIGHGHLPRRRRHLGVRAPLRGARQARRCSCRTPTSTRSSRTRSASRTSARSRTSSPRPTGNVQGAVTSDKADAIAGKVGARARRRSRCTSSPGTAPARR